MNGTTNTEQTRKTAADHALDAISKMVGDLATTTDKIEVPGGDRWSVTGEHGRVVYDSNGNQLALLFTDGEIDSMGDRWADHVREYAELDDDEAVFAVLAEHYRTQMAGGALVDVMAPPAKWGCTR